MLTEVNQIHIVGLVQGIGFRPFVYRLATRLRCRGWVENRTDGVLIVLEEGSCNLTEFLDALKNEAPEAADVENVFLTKGKAELSGDFTIKPSSETDRGITEICPDIAVCPQCLADMSRQPHRIDYPLLNCTHCGPRFSIIESLPYDRPNTTMRLFEMCPVCKFEYCNVHDRRFHAQPVACNHCGPKYSLHDASGQKDPISLKHILKQMSVALTRGEIIALKGTGGYHLMCDATNDYAVQRLRLRKKRDGKPMAVMFPDLETVHEYAFASVAEEGLLSSWQRPIVLLTSKNKLPPSVSNYLNTVGVILPYMPIHFLIFRDISCNALVFTSGNLSEEPVVTDDTVAENCFSDVADLLVTYNREIINRVDDSLVKMVSNTPLIIRRSRGYVPKPVRLGLDCEGIFAAGAELKNTFCIGKGRSAILSQHIGDLKNAETYDFYRQAVKRFFDLYRFTPQLVAVDLHPDFLSSGFAAAMKLPMVRVQHHHAHIASCMAEHHLDEPVIGLSFDGTGLGDDGNIWGSEILIADLANFQRWGHMEYIPLAGGDKAIAEPWRITLAMLHKIYGDEAIALAVQLFPQIPPEKIRAVSEALVKEINTVQSCGMGRLFDAVAAITGLCVEPCFEAEGPMRLESVASGLDCGAYQYNFDRIFDYTLLMKGIINDLNQKVPVAEISDRLHQTMANYAFSSIKAAHRETGIRKVVLSGGAFQNRILSEKIISALQNESFSTFIHSQVPPNDGGVSLGQLAVASKKRQSLCV